MAKETGWSEETILDMPLARTWMYRHALLRSFDAQTKYITTSDEKLELFELFNTL